MAKRAASAASSTKAGRTIAGRKSAARKTAAAPASRETAAPASPPSTAQKRKGAVLARVQRAIEQELARIETIIAGDAADEGMSARRMEAERTARTLATLARTLKEIARLREAKRKVKAKHDNKPRDLDQFRRELARRLDALVAQSAPDNSQ